MFLRKTSRFKDGKRHDYWSVAENARAGARVVQRQLLYLGEIDEDRQNAWLNAIDELEGRKAEDAASYLIPPQPGPKRETSASVRIRLSKMTVENIREWGACWLGLHLWDLVGLDEFWTSRLLPSSHGTDWLAVFKAPDGLPLAYEVMPGNTSDKGTQMQFVERYGEPKDDVALVLSQLGLRLPAQLPPKIDGRTIEEAAL